MPPGNPCVTGSKYLVGTKRWCFTAAYPPGERTALFQQAPAGNGRWLHHRASFFHLIEGEDFGYVTAAEESKTQHIEHQFSKRPHGSWLKARFTKRVQRSEPNFTSTNSQMRFPIRDRVAGRPAYIEAVSRWVLGSVISTTSYRFEQ